ncbi:MAG: hypothetical protein KDI63_03010 [Gammaproteobacteria bacterium]|nr:hypothetical protein [Gammaproteobacteria bacterium]
MKQRLLHETYPVYVLEVERRETNLHTVDEILACLKRQIDADEAALYIATYDHYGHTRSLKNGQIAEGILDAKSIVFCFGITLPDPQVMAVRPRSIGVAETWEGFVISFVEAPMPVANIAMENWAKSLVDRPVAMLG